MAATIDFIRREGESNTYCQQNNSFRWQFTWEAETAKDSGIFEPVPMPGWTAHMQVRRGPGKELIIDLSTQNNRITLHPSDGTITLQILKADTKPLKPGLYRYDLHLINPDGFETTLCEGAFEVVGGITE